MRRTGWLLLAVWALVAFVPLADAQTRRHPAADVELSTDGGLVAFYTRGISQTEFVVLDTASGRAFRLVLPEPHVELRDLSWVRASRTLLLVSRDPTWAPPTDSRSPSILGGYGTHIWSINFAADGAINAKVLATGDGVRLPALSPDGSKVAYFLPIRLPSWAPPKPFVFRQTAALFETDLATGATSRVSPSQYEFPRRLFYETSDTWLFSADSPAYLKSWEGREVWGSTHPDSPPRSGSFSQLTNGTKSFRMVRGEELPAYPLHKEPWPQHAPGGSFLVSVSANGEPILFGAPGPENTEGNRSLNPLLRAAGIAPVEMKNAYMLFRADGQRVDYFPPSPPEPFTYPGGGQAVDGALKRYAVMMEDATLEHPSYGGESEHLFLFEGQSVLLEWDVSDVLRTAVTVAIGGLK